VSAVLPDRLPLDLPEEDPAALVHTIEAVSGAAFRLGLLDVHLAGPAATAPGWLGSDAAAAAAQIGAAAGLARDIHGALTLGLQRLDRHAELLDHVRARIAVLRAQQQEDYDVAAARLAVLVSAPRPPGSLDAPAPVVALRDELDAAEVARRREHAALVDELRSDALETAHALSAATTVVGGTGRRGQEGPVLAHLAAVLPGWGDGELAARGTDLAHAILESPTLRGVQAPAGEVVLASSPAFAGALLTALGPSGVRRLFYLLGIDGLTPDDPWTVLLATSLGAAPRTNVEADPVGEVLDAPYVGGDGDSDLVAVGLGSVLAASAALRSGGVPVRTVAGWGRQVLVRENELRAEFPDAYRAVDRAGGRWPGLVDPVAEVLRILARAQDPAASAVLLDDAGAWGALLGRPFPTYAGGGAGLRAVVGQALAATGPDGDTATRAGLQAVGAGLTGGDPAQWSAHWTTAEALRAPLVAAAARRPALVADVVLATADLRCLEGGEDTALRGLGYLSIDQGASAVLGNALARWAHQQPAGAVLRAEQVPVAAFAVGSFVAVREYGQRLAHALHGVRLEEEAEARASNWAWAVDVLTAPLGGRLTGFANFVDPFAAHALDSDGTWDNGPDTGLVWNRADAAAAAARELQPPDPAATAVGAVTGYDRTTHALGLPLPPTPPRWSWQRALVQGAPLPFGINNLLEWYLDQFGYLPK